jgi:putative transposase
MSTKRGQPQVVELTRLWVDNYRVHRSVSSTRPPAGQGSASAATRLSRLMRLAGLRGVTRAKTVRTTRPDTAAARHPDLVKRDFTATGPNVLWVTDLTYVPT